MTFDDITARWRSQPVGHIDVPALGSRLDRVHRRHLVVFGACIAISVAASAYSVAALLRQGGGLMERAWPAWIVQAAGLTLLVSMYRRRSAAMRRAHLHAADALAVLSASLDEIDRRVAEMRWVGLAMLLFSVLIGYAVSGLIESGRMTKSNVRSFAMLWFGVIGVNFAWFAYSYFRRLRPRREHLRRLTEQYRAGR